MVTRIIPLAKSVGLCLANCEWRGFLPSSTLTGAGNIASSVRVWQHDMKEKYMKVDADFFCAAAVMQAWCRGTHLIQQSRPYCRGCTTC